MGGLPANLRDAPPEQAGDTGSPIDTTALIASLKAGHAVVTSGPMISASIGGQGPGSTVSAGDGPLKLHVSVRAAPWVDVNEIEVLGGGTTLARMSVPSRPGVTGRPVGDLVSARREAVRFEHDFEIPLKVAAPKFVVVVARGTRAMDDVLPYMPIQPLAFTNPIWLGPTVAVSGGATGGSR